MGSPFSLEHKTVLVTGASSGIGRQTAMAFADAGARVLLTGRNEARLDETRRALPGGDHISFPLDLNDEGAVAKAVEGLPELNGVVSASGVLKVLPTKMLREQDLSETMQTNFVSPYFLVQSLLNRRKLLPGSAVVFVSSINGIYCNTKGFGAYASSKAALNSMMKNLALEYAGKRIRFNAVNPGMIKTEMYLNLLQTVSERDIAEDKKKYPMGDYGEPVDVANACIFLVSDASKWITGTSLIVDGGFTIN